MQYGVFLFIYSVSLFIYNQFKDMRCSLCYFIVLFTTFSFIFKHGDIEVLHLFILKFY